MTSNQEFQAHLQAGKVSDAISLLVHQLVAIEVTTELSSPGVVNTATVTTGLQTQISLLDGTVSTTVNPELVNHESYQKLLDFHTAQIVATNQAIRGNLRSLQELLPLLEKPPTVIPTNTPTPIAEESQPKIKATLSVSKVADSKTQLQPTILTEDAPSPAIVQPSSAPSGPDPIAAPTIIPVPATDTAPAIESGKIPAVEPPTMEPLPSAVQVITPAAESLEPHVAETPAPELTPPPVNNLSSSVAAVVVPGVIASGMAATVAQAGSPKIEEADSIPNKFDQVLKSAGLKEEAGENPFLATPPPTAAVPVDVTKDKDVDVAQLLHESDEEWDEWLLEEDAILSELSQASQEATKDKIPDWDESWFTQSDSGILGKPPSPAEDWERFIPEYTDLDVPSNKGQANVERFRQNLVNDPQLMNELLAELDDIEKMNKNDRPKA